MTLRAQANFDAGDLRERAERLLSRLRSISRDQDISNAEQLREMVTEYYNMIESLGSPEFKALSLDPRETATFQRLNEIFNDIEADIISLYRAYTNLANHTTQSFNRIQSIIDGARADLQNTTAMALTAALTNDIGQRGTFVALDTFMDDTTRDPSSTAENVFGGGSLILKRTEVLSAITPATDVEMFADSANPYGMSPVKIKLGPLASFLVNPPVIGRPYEGDYYDLLGQMIPEGRSLKLIAGDNLVSNSKLVPAVVPEDKLRDARRNMLDGSPDTYWQVERAVASYQEGLSEPGVIDQTFPYDFRAQLLLDFNDVFRVSALTLNPMNFGERAWLEVSEIETSVDAQNWSRVPGLHNHNFYNVLTDEANKQLNTRLASAIMAPNKYAYTGQGVWVFPEREARYVRVSLLQRTPVEQPYEVVRLRMQRQVTKKKKASKVLGIKLGKDKSSTKTEDKIQELSYEESLLLFQGEGDYNEKFGSYRESEGVDINIAGHDIFSGGGSSVEKSAWQVSGYELVTKNNIVRYAIGIRDLDVLTAKYELSSVYVSAPFSVPSPIRQISLRADENIPDEFGPGRWVKYFVSVDDGASWHPIAPFDKPPVYGDTGRIPTVIQVNGYVPEEANDDRFGYIDIGAPAGTVRCKIEISRPAEFDGATPVIKRYSIEMLTEETFGRIIV